MDDRTYNPDDPLFLVSRSLDGELSADERRRLDELLAESPSLGEEARQIQSTDAAIRQWGRTRVELDWEHHAKLIQGVLAESSDSGLGGVDRLLTDWSRSQPDFDEEALAQSVLARIAPARRQPGIVRWTLRIGAPLAAAAAVVFALTASFWSTPAPVVVVSIGRAAVSTPEATVAVVSIGRSNGGGRVDTTASGVGFITMGSSPLSRTMDEPAPL